MAPLHQVQRQRGLARSLGSDQQDRDAADADACGVDERRSRHLLDEGRKYDTVHRIQEMECRAFDRAAAWERKPIELAEALHQEIDRLESRPANFRTRLDVGQHAGRLPAIGVESELSRQGSDRDDEHGTTKPSASRLEMQVSTSSAAGAAS